jgi:hypothetical protein
MLDKVRGIIEDWSIEKQRRPSALILFSKSQLRVNGYVNQASASEFGNARKYVNYHV